MTDEPPTEPPSPDLNRPWELPQDVLSAWVAMPADSELNFVLTRRVVDHLFFALNNITLSLANFDIALVAYGNNEPALANAQIFAGRRDYIEALSHSRRLLAEFMTQATGVPYERDA